MKEKYYTIVSWAESQNISDNLNHHKITFALYVVSWTQCQIEINAGDLERVKQILPYAVDWKEV